MFAYWYIVGDDFDVTKWMFSEFPIDLNGIPPEVIVELEPLVKKLETAMKNAASFKLNAGKKVGNYNLAKCRHVTDVSDQIFAKYLGLDNVWNEIEDYYYQAVRTDFEEEE